MASTPASLVIERFGGQIALASAMGKAQSTIAYWAKVGRIPSKWHADVLRIASERGIDLSADDLIQQPVVGEVVRTLPRATHWGELPIGDVMMPCYVLDDGRRVLSRNGATNLLAGSTSGDLDSYVRRGGLPQYMPPNFAEDLVEFEMEDVTSRIARVRGLTAELFLDVCRAYVLARDQGALTTDRQKEIAVRASMFLSACAKVGLIALIDEATGNQYDRPAEELRLKLKLFLEDEMREWEKTFPDELWREFGRLTHWEGPVHLRPRYWGRLVMELVYDYLDKDVAAWLRSHAPQPRHGTNYHQWLSSQYGLKKLTEHIWMLVGMASACASIGELRQKMAEKYGRQPVQILLYLDPPSPPRRN